CLWVQKDAATVYGSIILTDDMTLDRPLTVYANGQLTVNGTLTCQKGLVNNGTLTNNGTVLVAGGDLDNRGTLAIAATGTLHVNGTPDAPRTLTNSGTLTVNGSLELDDTTLQNDSGTLDGTGLCVLTDKSEITGGSTPLQVEYRIFLDGNGATLTDTTLVTMEHKPVRLPTPTREDYQFEGWFTQPEGGTQVTAKTPLTASQTLYAAGHGDLFADGHGTLGQIPAAGPGGGFVGQGGVGIT
ncbi:InlB B-repeat-containing protein, partial [Gemmiger formicilis]|uniref:InlB B-repeat-containing protein n=1 Tax=Gemmiger formicilis TaxID=745368 RepID=UPI001957ED99